MSRIEDFKEAKQQIIDSFGSEEAFFQHFGNAKYIGKDKYGISMWV